MQTEPKVKIPDPPRDRNLQDSRCQGIPGWCLQLCLHYSWENAFGLSKGSALWDMVWALLQRAAIRYQIGKIKLTYEKNQKNLGLVQQPWTSSDSHCGTVLCFLMEVIWVFKLFGLFSSMRLPRWILKFSWAETALNCRLHLQIYFCPNTGITSTAEHRIATLNIWSHSLSFQSTQLFDGNSIYLLDPCRHVEELFVNPRMGFSIKRQIAFCVQSSENWQQAMCGEPRK